MWTGVRDAKGYGRFSLDGKKQRAHRVSYWLATGVWPAGSFVLHSCDRPSCVRPDHLSLGNNSDNVQQSIRRGRWKHCSLTPCQVLELQQEYRDLPKGPSGRLGSGSMQGQVTFGVCYPARQPMFGHWQSECLEFLIDAVGGQPSPQKTAEPSPGSDRPRPGPR